MITYDIPAQVIRSHAHVICHQKSQTVYWQLLGNEKRYTLADGLIVFVSLQDLSIDMQLDVLYGSSRDLVLSNFQFDLLVSKLN